MATRTIKSAGGDYTSLASWEADRNGDITGLGPEIAECYNMSLTETVTFNGWTTTAADYIRIYVPTAERHNGTFSTGFKITGGGADDTLRLAEEYIRFEGLAIEATGNFFGINDVGIGSAGEVRIQHCLIHRRDKHGSRNRNLDWCCENLEHRGFRLLQHVHRRLWN
jgi:hypothetical protein